MVADRNQIGIYVECRINAPLERVWALTQIPSMHQRWDLRFSNITYLPKATPEEPQRFLYETRIGFGAAIRGTGESVATRQTGSEAVSSLRFDSADPKSLIRDGAGYWRYVESGDTLRFFTWYDYRVRFGILGRAVDKAIFRPLMGWVTAWSFDRLRLWAEEAIAPEQAMQLFAIHAVARVALAFVWLWHGLVPKLIFRNADELTMLMQAGVPASLLPHMLQLFGTAEIAMALLVLATWRWRSMFVLQPMLMAAALAGVAMRSPAYLTHAFNPVTLNLLVIAIAAVGWIASTHLPSARRCLRIDPRLNPKHEEMH